MSDEIADRFDWRLPFYGFAAAAIVTTPTVLLDRDAGVLVGIPLGLLASMVLLVILSRTERRQNMAGLSMILVFGTLAWFQFRHLDAVRTTGRWLFLSHWYKAQILAQSIPARGELKHAEWDGWGFPGAGNTVVYVVFDPANSLAAAAKNHAPGKYNGLPCAVQTVRRLENRWYTVLFYTDTAWNKCT